MVLKRSTLDPLIVENYQPASLLPFLAKTVQWPAFTQITIFLSLSNLLDTNQLEFRCEHFTDTAFQWLIFLLAQATGQSSALIPLDYFTMFDSINQIILHRVNFLEQLWIDLKSYPISNLQLTSKVS